MQVLNEIMPLIGVGASGLLALLSVAVLLNMALEDTK